MDMQMYQEAFGASDKTTLAMQDAIAKWFSLYYDSTATKVSDPSQRIPYTLVNKLMKTVFSEYAVTAGNPNLQKLLDGLTGISKEKNSSSQPSGTRTLRRFSGLAR